MSEITIQRTGRIYSFAGVEFLVKFPNGDIVSIWSPPWASEVDEDGSPRQDEAAMNFAQQLWDKKQYKVLSPEYRQEIIDFHKNTESKEKETIFAFMQV